MRLRHRSRRLIVSRLALVLAASWMLVPAPALAEELQQAPADTRLGGVEVVGSRIKRVDLETSQPVLILSRAEIEQTGQVSLGDLLQDLAVHGAALNTTVNNGGDGSTRIDLRNLGDQRTLVLVDGRRWIAGIDGAVDLNSIPLAIIERIEVLKDGASAVYGSDAIAGVVNLITRRDFVGYELRTRFGTSEFGDGEQQSHELSWGVAGDDHGLSASLSHVRQDEIYAGDRRISAVPTFGLPGNDTFAGASSFIPNGLFGFGPIGLCPYNPAGNYPANGRCSRPDNRPLTQNRTTFDPATGGYRLFDPRRDGYNFAPDNYLQTPQERSALFLIGHRQFADSVEASAQLLFNQRRSRQQLAPNPILVGAVLPGLSRIVVPADHVYNPFGQNVSGLFIRPGGQVRQFDQDADTLRFAAGLTGSIDLADRQWSWNADLVYGRSRVLADSTGLVDPTRLALALGASFRDASGQARCGSAAAPIADCVPLDPFRGPQALTPAMVDYLYYQGQDRTQTESWVYSLGLSGELMDLPAGSLAFAAGLEHRRELGESRIDPRRAANENLANSNFGGDTRVNEVYAELSLPLLAEVRGAEWLEASVAARWSDYDSFGFTSNIEGGLHWKPIEPLLLRVSYSEGLRAPIVSELFFPNAESFGALEDDPCAAFNEPNSVQRGNCAADGVPGGAYEPVGAPYQLQTGGNQALQPESSTSRTAGVVFSPTAIPGLDLSLDWYRVRIDNAITPVDAAQLLRACADSGAAEACNRTLRDANGELLFLDARLLNSGALDVEGYDFSASYRFDSAIGRFSIRWDSSYYSRYETEVPRGSGRRSALGHSFFLEPGFRLRSNLQLAWDYQDWSAALGLHYYSALDEACSTPVRSGRTDLCSRPEVDSSTYPGFGENDLPSRTYVDAQIGWQTPWQGRIVLGAQNLFDRDPPVSYSSTFNSFDPAYPIPGRFWYLQLNQRF